MSSSSARSVEERVLLLLATKQGPAIDQVDALPVDPVSVREVVREFAAESPAAVRSALLELIGKGFVRLMIGDVEDDLLDHEDSVALRVRGLARARLIDPECGRPRNAIKLRFAKGKLLDARFDTGDRERDRELNASGLNLACFYLVADVQPNRKKPLVAGECVDRLELLAAHGVGVRTGRGPRTRPSEETIRAAFDRLRSIIPLRCLRPGEDKRRVSWALEGALPPVVLERHGRAQFDKWPRLVNAVRRVLRGLELHDANGEVVEPAEKAESSEKPA